METLPDQASPPDQALVIQQPPAPAGQLILLFHGVGATAAGMAPLGRRLAAAFPQAFVVSVGAPDVCDLGSGRQWFSLQGVSDENRAARVEAAMPAFVATIRHWQKVSGVGVEGTALVGFSQGAIMALECARERESPAGRIVSIAGRFARLPERATDSVTLYLLHGKADPVIPYAHTVAAAERLVSLGGDVVADVIPFAGHQVDDEMAELLVERLRTYLPKRHWDAAMRATGRADNE
jgi:phospholipase/carboxylesterase